MEVFTPQHCTLDAAPWPKGHVHWYAPVDNTLLVARLSQGANVHRLDPDAPPKAQTGHTLVAWGEEAVCARAKEMALTYGLPLLCLPSHYAVEAMHPYWLQATPQPTATALTMRTLYIDGVFAPRPTDCADLYAMLAACYVGLFDARLCALWHNDEQQHDKAIAACRHALHTAAIYRDPHALSREVQALLPLVSLQIEWFAHLISLYKQGKMRYNTYRFAAAIGVAQALRLAPQLPAVALPPDRTAVLGYLAAMGTHHTPVSPTDIARRDWIWQTTRAQCRDYFAAMPAVCAIYRSLLPDCGYQATPDLDAWDVAHLLPVVAEVCGPDSALGHLYHRGTLNTWIDSLA